MQFRLIFSFSIMVIATVLCSVANAEVVVIVSAKSNVTSLTIDQTARIFLGKEDKFPNAQIAIPVDQGEGTEVRDEFYSKVTHKSASQLAAFWAKLIFTGEGRLPQALEDDKAVIKFVTNNPSAIGYIDENSLTRKVRVVLKP